MIEQENFPKAVEYFDKSLAYRPEIVESLRGKAESLADLGRFSESQETFEGCSIWRPRRLSRAART